MAKKQNPSQLYSIKELERQTGLPRRTIHYYVKEGMIPPPEGQGRNARYGEEHRLRLLLIRDMKDSTHLRLEGIREIIEPMSEDDLRREVTRLREERGDETAEDRLESDWERMAEGSPLPPDANLAYSMRIGSRATRSRSPFASLKDRAQMAHDALRRRTDDPSPAAAFEEADSWNRVRVSNDVEIHYRAPAEEDDDGLLDKILQLVMYARQLFR